MYVRRSATLYLKEAESKASSGKTATRESYKCEKNPISGNETWKQNSWTSETHLSATLRVPAAPCTVPQGTGSDCQTVKAELGKFNRTGLWRRWRRRWGDDSRDRWPTRGRGRRRRTRCGSRERRGKRMRSKEKSWRRRKDNSNNNDNAKTAATARTLIMKKMKAKTATPTRRMKRTEKRNRNSKNWENGKTDCRFTVCNTNKVKALVHFYKIRRLDHTKYIETATMTVQNTLLQSVFLQPAERLFCSRDGNCWQE